MTDLTNTPELNRFADVLAIRFKEMLLQVKCKEKCPRPATKKPNRLTVPATGLVRVVCDRPSYGILDTVPNAPVRVVSGQEFAPGTDGNETIRPGLDLTFPTAGIYSIQNRSSAPIDVEMVEAEDVPRQTFFREGVAPPPTTFANATAVAAAAQIVAANARRRFLAIFQSDGTAASIGVLGFSNAVTPTLGIFCSRQSGTGVNPVTFGPGGMFPLYLGAIWAIRQAAADVTLTVVEWAY